MSVPTTIAFALSMLAAVPAQRSSAMRIEATPETPAAPIAAPSTTARLVIDLLDEVGVRGRNGEPYVEALPPAARRSIRVARLPDGCWTCAVEPGRSYAVGWFDTEHGLVEREVLAGPPASETRATLVLGPKRRAAQLTVELQASGENELIARIAPSVCSPWGGRELLRGGEPTSKGEPGEVRRATFLLPPGSYIVRAGPKSNLLPWHLPVETAIDLHEGEERSLALYPVLGGHVRLALVASAGKRPLGTAFSVFGNVDVPLRYSSTSAHAGFLTTRRPLAPGRCTLAVDVPGFEREEVQVEVVAGRMVDVPLELRPRD